MQKIISYSYPNRIQLLADLAGFNVEYTNVYQRNVKIYSGIDNTLEFDIKNADQKRLDLTTYDLLELNLMDISGNPIGSSPYELTPTQLKGIATVTIPAQDLTNLSNQTFKYSIIATKNSIQSLFYTDTHFGGLGIIELIESVIPVTKPVRTFNSFSGEIDYLGNVTNHSSAIPAKFYEAIPTSTISFEINLTNFIGSIYLQATTDSTISVESFKHATKIQEFNTSVATSNTVRFNNIPVGDYAYFRICWNNPIHGFTYGDQSSYNDQIVATYGKVNKILVS